VNNWKQFTQVRHHPLAVFSGNLKDRFRQSPYAGRLVGLVPILNQHVGKYTDRKSADERRHQILHQAIALVFEGFNTVHVEGAHWKDVDSYIRFIKPFLGLWIADGKEMKALAGFLKVSTHESGTCHSRVCIMTVICDCHMCLTTTLNVLCLQRRCTICACEGESLVVMKDLRYEEKGPRVFTMQDMMRLRRKCIDEHEWPGCKQDPEFTSDGQCRPAF
jgi:hypothetical protein